MGVLVLSGSAVHFNREIYGWFSCTTNIKLLKNSKTLLEKTNSEQESERCLCLCGITRTSQKKKNIMIKNLADENTQRDCAL